MQKAYISISAIILTLVLSLVAGGTMYEIGESLKGIEVPEEEIIEELEDEGVKEEIEEEIEEPVVVQPKYCETVDCDKFDGWINYGSIFTCNEGEEVCICQTQKYRDYYCSEAKKGCFYNLTEERVEKSSCTLPQVKEEEEEQEEQQEEEDVEEESIEAEITNIEIVATTTSVAIEWQTNFDADSDVRVTGNSLDLKVDSGDFAKEHSVEIEGLIPHKTYNYKISATTTYYTKASESGTFDTLESEFNVKKATGVNSWIFSAEGERYKVEAIAVTIAEYVEDRNITKIYSPAEIDEKTLIFTECVSLTTSNFPYSCPARTEWEVGPKWGYGNKGKDSSNNSIYIEDNQESIMYLPGGEDLHFFKATGELSGDVSCWSSGGISVSWMGSCESVNSIY